MYTRQIYKINPNSNIKENIHTQTSNTNFRRVSPFDIALIKNNNNNKQTNKQKHIRPGNAGIIDPSVQFINTPYQIYMYQKEWTEIETLLIFYQFITANTSAMWQHAAHTTDQISSSC